MTTLAVPPLAASNAPIISPPLQSPLSPSHLAEIEHANKRAKKIRRAATVATIDAWLSAIFASLTLLSAIFSPVSLLLGIALAVVAFNAFKGAKRLRQFDLAAPRFLALNQVALALTIIAYAACSLWAASRGTPELISTANSAGPEVAQALGNFHLDRLYWLLNLAIYGGLALATIIAQGSAALYYASRKKILRTYLNSTPPWLLQLQKTQAGS